jgi:aspartate/methionine/tyrosine aminotransferase
MFAERTNWNLVGNRLSEALARHRASGKRLFDLTASNPTQCGIAYDNEVILAALGNPAALRYEPSPKGLASARLAVTEYYSARGVAISAEDIVLTASTSEAYSFVFRLLCNAGDEVLIPAPSYPLFGFLADIQDVKLVRYPLVYDHGWQIDFHSLQQAITARTRGVIVVNPNNPTGHFVKQNELVKLNEICASRDMALIADEVFLDFALGDRTPLSFAGNNAALTFAMSGLSKIAGLPQMKMAWVITSGHEELKRPALERLEVIADTYLSPNAPVQLATPVFLEQRPGFQKQVMGRVRRNLAELDEQLAGQKTCRRLEVEGGWYAVLRVPATSSDEEVAIELLTDGDIYVHPGHFFDFAGEGYLVVSLIAPEEEFAEGIRILLSAV